MQSALLLAEKGHPVHVLDSAPAIGGFFPLLDRTFPTNSCGVCFMSPKPPAYCPIYETRFHENISLLTNSSISSVEGGAGDFNVSCVTKPRFVDTEKCDRCGKCADVCPIEVPMEMGGGLEKRKAIYLPFAQAIPRSYVIDEKTCTRCGKCVDACAPGAIDLDQKQVEKNLEVGAIVLGFGFEPYQGEIKGEFGLGRYDNVLSSIQYERMLSFSGPTKGIPTHRTSGIKAGRIAFIQCVGSRDPSCGREYCSSICCMYATKQAMVSKERVEDLDAAVFYIDIRTMGKNYERYYEKAQKEYGIRYIKCAVSTVRELQQSKNLIVSYGYENGELKEEEFDTVVLSLGFTPPPDIEETARKMGVELNEYGFCSTGEFRPTETSVPGIYVAGAFREPRDIPESVVEACSAADDVSMLLDRYEEQPKEAGTPEPADEIDDETLRIGVFLCDDKGLLSRALKTDDLTREMKADPDTPCVELIDVSSLDKGIEEIEKLIKKNKLNRAVVAGYRCMEIRISLEKLPGVFSSYTNLFDCADIGEQCLDVHAEDPERATSKAINLIMASLEKVKSAVPQKREKKQLNGRILVIGGGISGMTSALSLAEQGMDVTLVEKENELGGNARTAYFTLKGSDIQTALKDITERVENHSKIEILNNSKLKSLTGRWGDFHSVLAAGEDEREVDHGAVIFAVGGKEIRPDGYLYGDHEGVVTQKEMEHMLMSDGEKMKKLRSVAMIQCVGSRDDAHPYCSRVCCSHAVKNALKLKEMNPEVDVYVFYRDVRTYGFYEKYYRQIRDRGVFFIRYEPKEEPEVTSVDGGLQIAFIDKLVGREMELKVDLLALSTGIEPNDNEELAEIAGVEINEDGFFSEANPKSAPLDSVERGKYFCGLCHSPNFIEDAICQAKASAARASTLLWSGEGQLAGDQVFVNERLCCGCGICVSTCPYNARVIDEMDNKAKVLADLCKGCGTCAIACPNGASQQRNFERDTVFHVLDRILA